jgi:hypothetical protein
MKRLLSISLVVCLGSPALAASQRPAVIDNAGLFTPKVVERANQLLAGVREQYGIDLCVDTFKEMPGIDPENLRTMRSRDRARTLRQFAEQRADDAHVDGIYVLVSTAPRNTILIGWPDRREGERLFVEDGGGLSTFKREDRLRKPFARELGDNPDRALLLLVDHFREAVRSRSRDAAPPSPLETLPALVVVGGLFGLWVLLSLLRRWRARKEAALTGAPPGPIYQPAMLGSLFGVPAGYWVYDRLFRLERPRPSAPPAELVPPVPPHTPDPDAEPTPAPEAGSATQ